MSGDPGKAEDGALEPRADSADDGGQGGGRRAHLLLVEDEEAIAEGLLFNLARQGYRVELATDGRQALDRAGAGGFDLIILDLRLPEIEGLEVCRRLREDGDFTPIVMLTARDQPGDVVLGLQSGADDYVTKPFDLSELLARIEGQLRRAGWSGRDDDEEEDAGEEDAAGPSRFEFGPYWVDFDSWQAATRRGVVQLSQKEIAVMKMFAARPGQVITRRELLAEVWQLPDHPNTRVVDNVIVSLRKAFEENGWRPRYIQTVRGAGYRFALLQEQDG